MGVYETLAQANSYKPKEDSNQKSDWVVPSLGNCVAKITKVSLEQKPNKPLKLCVIYRSDEGSFSDRMDLEGEYLGKAYKFCQRVLMVDEVDFTDLPELIEKKAFNQKVELAILAGKNADYPKIYVNSVILLDSEKPFKKEEEEEGTPF